MTAGSSNHYDLMGISPPPDGPLPTGLMVPVLADVHWFTLP
jgi:hypothetical protein